MQVVFVHGVNNRDAGDGEFARDVEARTDRLSRLAFGGGATIRNPYWGKFGRPARTLGSVPRKRGTAVTLGLDPNASSGGYPVFDPAGHDLREIVGSMSIAALQEAANSSPEVRREVEDYWMAAADFAEMRPHPPWLARPLSLDEISARIDAEVEVMKEVRPLGGTWKTSRPISGANDFAAARLRDWSSGFLAQFLGDAFMFFSRREAGNAVRREIATSILDAARTAEAEGQPLLLIGHSMGGSVLHDMLSDPAQVRDLEEELGRPLKVDLFMSVGTQVGLFAELGQFTPSRAGRPLAVRCARYWNVFDFADTLSFLASPVLPDVVDLEVNTAGGVLHSHNAYFDNAVFFTRLRRRLVEAGLAS
ncbi:MAG: hypothetical protein K2X54_25100 [Methylobacterium organophilum]|nr:hypothetical protein [Methylobacterium organophilum]